MVDSRLIVEHYKNREELERILVEEKQRKTVIKLAVLQVVIKANKNDIVDSEGLRQKVDDYELHTNKLKQDHSTKVIGLEARMELLAAENLLLRERLKANTHDGGSNTSKMNGHVNSDRPSIRSESYLLPTFNSINRSIGSQNGKVLTPIKQKIAPRRKYITSKIMHLVKSPIVSSDTLLDFSSDKDQNPLLTNGSRRTLSTSSQSLPNGKPSPAKVFVKNFDISSPSPSPSVPDSPIATPSKISANIPQPTEAKLKSDTPDLPQAHESQGKVVADDTFTSANSSAASNQSSFSGDESKKKKNKKLQLWKSEISRKSNPVEKRSQSLGLEDENVNSLNFYDDENFLTDDSPVKSGNKKRPAEASDTGHEIVSKKRKMNIFKID